MRRGLFLLLVGLAVLAGAGCATTPPQALAMTPQTLQIRQMQSRRFDTADEKKLLAACAALLQDLGFNIDESCTDLGLIVASKERSAVETGQVIASVFLSVLGGPSTYDEHQRFRASVVTRPADNHQSVTVRVTFQRTVWNTQRQITRNEPLNKPEQYQEFFRKLSEGVFLDAHDI